MLVLVLVGPKGSGKTTIGRFLEERCEVRFVEVEAIARRVLEQHGGAINESYARDCFAAIRETIDNQRSSDPLCIETTGASRESKPFLDTLRQRYDVRLIRVRAAAPVCAQRIATRDSMRQVAVSAALIREMHQRTESLDWPWDLELTNDAPLDPETVARAVQPLLAR